MSEVLYDLNAEQATLGSLMLDPDLTPLIADKLNPDDFGVQRCADLYRVLLSLFDAQMPYDTVLILDEARKLSLDLDVSFVVDCQSAANSSLYAEHYAGIVKQYQEKRKHLAIATEYAKRIYSGERPEEITAWLQAAMAGGAVRDKSSMSTAESLVRQRELIEKWESPENAEELERWSWKWGKWNQLINPATKGMLAVVMAPDGVGKSVIAEEQAEHWALQGNKVVFFHFELDKDVMITRRLSRWSGLTYRQLVTNRLTAEQRRIRNEVEEKIQAWFGHIEYVHCPGWDIDRVINRARSLQQQGLCDAIVLDYFQKIQPSPRQQRNRWSETKVEEDTVEQLKIFSESDPGCRVLMLAQFNKEGKKRSAGNLDRTAGRGAGAITEKANLVVLLHREKLEGGKYGAGGVEIVPPGGYDNEATVKVDKNTLGGTGEFNQYSNSFFGWTDEDPHMRLQL